MENRIKVRGGAEKGDGKNLKVRGRVEKDDGEWYKS
jgi:hypothetical protein